MKNEMIQSKGSLYVWSNGGIIYGYTKARVPEGDPYIEWKGEKMPHSLWQQILAFFIWTFQESGKTSSPDEALVHLFYNEEEHKWLAWAPPQRGCGMTVKTVDDHPNWKQAEAFVGYVKVGTGHHHCKASAFQSGTDKNDEETGNGLHFTIGELDKEFLDVHARAVYNGNMVEVNTKECLGIVDWVEMDDKYRKLNLPGELHYAANYYSIKSRPPKDTRFPEQWKENFIKWGTPTNNGHSHCSQGNLPMAGPGGKQQGKDGYWSHCNGTSTWVDFKQQFGGNGSGNVLIKNELTNVEKAEIEMEEMLKRGISLVELCITSENMAKLPRKKRNETALMTSVNEVLSNYGLNPTWLDKWIMEQEQAGAYSGWLGAES